MCVRHFYYSEKQNDILEDVHGLPPAEVFINDIWWPYSEMSRNEKVSNWDDAVYLGVADEWDIKINGKIQIKLYKSDGANES